MWLYCLTAVFDLNKWGGQPAAHLPQVAQAVSVAHGKTGRAQQQIGQKVENRAGSIELGAEQ